MIYRIAGEFPTSTKHSEYLDVYIPPILYLQMFLSYSLVQPERVAPIYHRMEGLEIEVNERCTGCGICRETCYMKAIRVENGRARHTEACRECGRCASACPNGAVDIRLNDPAYIDKIVEKYLSLAKID